MAVGSLALAGGAASGVPTVHAARNSAVGRVIVVDASGRTLYRLAPESAHELLCTGACLRSWPPVTVPSRRTKLLAGPGVHGRLATLRRPDGQLQVMLRGLPLYRFSRDRIKGQANGRAIHSLGGEWNVVLASAPRLPPNPPPTGPAPGPKLPPTPPPF